MFSITGLFKRGVALGVCFCFTLSLFPEAHAAVPALELTARTEVPRVFAIDIPVQMASVDEWYQAPARPDPKMIVHIQDAHANYEAQTNIRDLLRHLSRQYGFKTILVEGAAETLDPNYLKLFPDKKKNLELMDALAKEGEVTGTEMFLMEDEESMQGVGIEKPELYRANYEALVGVYQADEFAGSFFEAYEGKLGQVASRTFGPRMIQALNEWRKFESGHREFLPFVSQLADLSKRVLELDLAMLYSQIEWPQLTRLLVLQRLEKELDAPTELGGSLRERAIAEKQAVVDLLKLKNASAGLIQALENFNEKSANLNRIGASEIRDAAAPRAMLEMLVEEGSKIGLDIRQYSAFAKYAGYLIIRSEVVPGALFEEIKKLFDRLLDKLVSEAASISKENDVGDADRRRLLLLYRDLVLAKKLMKLELTRDEWLLMAQRQDRFTPEDFNRRMREVLGQGIQTKQEVNEDAKRQLESLKQVFNAAFRFYRAATNREDYFFQKMQETLAKNNKAVLVTGGFHSEGMKELMRKYDISYGTVTPRITQEFSSDIYRKVMMTGIGANQEPRIKNQAPQSHTLPATEHMAGNLALDPKNRAELRRGNVRRIAESLGLTGASQVNQNQGGDATSAVISKKSPEARVSQEAVKEAFNKKIEVLVKRGNVNLKSGEMIWDNLPQQTKDFFMEFGVADEFFNSGARESTYQSEGFVYETVIPRFMDIFTLDELRLYINDLKTIDSFFNIVSIAYIMPDMRNKVGKRSFRRAWPKFIHLIKNSADPNKLYEREFYALLTSRVAALPQGEMLVGKLLEAVKLFGHRLLNQFNLGETLDVLKGWLNSLFMSDSSRAELKRIKLALGDPLERRKLAEEIYRLATKVRPPNLPVTAEQEGSVNQQGNTFYLSAALAVSEVLRNKFGENSSLIRIIPNFQILSRAQIPGPHSILTPITLMGVRFGEIRVTGLISDSEGGKNIVTRIESNVTPEIYEAILLSFLNYHMRNHWKRGKSVMLAMSDDEKGRSSSLPDRGVIYETFSDESPVLFGGEPGAWEYDGTNFNVIVQNGTGIRAERLPLQPGQKVAPFQAVKSARSEARESLIERAREWIKAPHRAQSVAGFGLMVAAVPALFVTLAASASIGIWLSVVGLVIGGMYGLTQARLAIKRAAYESRVGESLSNAKQSPESIKIDSLEARIAWQAELVSSRNAFVAEDLYTNLVNTLPSDLISFESIQKTVEDYFLLHLPGSLSVPVTEVVMQDPSGRILLFDTVIAEKTKVGEGYDWVEWDALAVVLEKNINYYFTQKTFVQKILDLTRNRISHATEELKGSSRDQFINDVLKAAGELREKIQDDGSFAANFVSFLFPEFIKNQFRVDAFDAFDFSLENSHIGQVTAAGQDYPIILLGQEVGRIRGEKDAKSPNGFKVVADVPMVSATADSASRETMGKMFDELTVALSKRISRAEMRIDLAQLSGSDSLARLHKDIESQMGRNFVQAVKGRVSSKTLELTLETLSDGEIGKLIDDDNNPRAMPELFESRFEASVSADGSVQGVSPQGRSLAANANAITTIIKKWVVSESGRAQQRFESRGSESAGKIDPVTKTISLLLSYGQANVSFTEVWNDAANFIADSAITQKNKVALHAARVDAILRWEGELKNGYSPFSESATSLIDAAVGDAEQIAKSSASSAEEKTRAIANRVRLLRLKAQFEKAQQKAATARSQAKKPVRMEVSKEIESSLKQISFESFSEILQALPEKISAEDLVMVVAYGFVNELSLKKIQTLFVLVSPKIKASRIDLSEVSGMLVDLFPALISQEDGHLIRGVTEDEWNKTDIAQVLQLYSILNPNVRVDVFVNSSQRKPIEKLSTNFHLHYVEGARGALTGISRLKTQSGLWGRISLAAFSETYIAQVGDPNLDQREGFQVVVEEQHDDPLAAGFALFHGAKMLNGSNQAAAIDQGGIDKSQKRWKITKASLGLISNIVQAYQAAWQVQKSA